MRYFAFIKTDFLHHGVTEKGKKQWNAEETKKSDNVGSSKPENRLGYDFKIRLFRFDPRTIQRI
jgi:hypothetical protein